MFEELKTKAIDEEKRRYTLFWDPPASTSESKDSIRWRLLRSYDRAVTLSSTEHKRLVESAKRKSNDQSSTLR